MDSGPESVFDLFTVQQTLMNESPLSVSTIRQVLWSAYVNEELALCLVEHPAEDTPAILFERPAEVFSTLFGLLKDGKHLLGKRLNPAEVLLSPD